MATLTPTSEDTCIYEIAILIPYPLNQKEEQDIIKNVEEHIDEAGGKQMTKDVWGRRGLAYKIGGHDEGNFVIYHYEMEPDKLKELDTALRIIPGVLRHLIIKPPKNYEVVKFSETYVKWMKERESTDETKMKEKEEEIQRRVAEKAKRQVRKAEEQKKEEKKEKEETPAAPMKEEQLTEELEKLISDDLEL